MNNFMVYSGGGIPVGDYNPDRCTERPTGRPWHSSEVSKRSGLPKANTAFIGPRRESYLQL
jgi:hypothetical protein